MLVFGDWVWSYPVHGAPAWAASASSTWGGRVTRLRNLSALRRGRPHSLQPDRAPAPPPALIPHIYLERPDALLGSR